MPHTFSFRLRESTFSEDLQNFAKLFRSLEERQQVQDLAPVSTYVDKYGRDYGVYYDFDIRTHQRSPPSIWNANKFSNVKAEHINPDSFETLYAGFKMWILKPGNLSRGQGVELFTSLDQLKKFLQIYVKDGYLIQDYSIIGYSDDDYHSPYVDFLDKYDSKSKWRLPR